MYAGSAAANGISMTKRRRRPKRKADASSSSSRSPAKTKRVKTEDDNDKKAKEPIEPSVFSIVLLCVVFDLIACVRPSDTAFEEENDDDDDFTNVIGVLHKAKDRKRPPHLAVVNWDRPQKGWWLIPIAEASAVRFVHKSAGVRLIRMREQASIANGIKHLITSVARHRPDVVQTYGDAIVEQLKKVETYREELDAMPCDTESETDDGGDEDDDEEEDEPKPKIEAEIDPMLQPQHQVSISPDQAKIAKVLADEGFQVALAALANQSPVILPTPPGSADKEKDRPVS
jgi:hypothetical protein